MVLLFVSPIPKEYRVEDCRLCDVEGGLQSNASSWCYRGLEM